jgi:GTP-binding protein
MTIDSAVFVKSSPDYRQCPEENFPEFAFIGRSNVGKSSLINMLAGKKNLAKTSGTPGKTQLINHFIVNESWYLVDLPGYGFAKASKKNRVVWQKMINDYLLNRENLVSTFILIDSRHEPQKIDLELIRWFGENELEFVLVFTKVDKLSKAKKQHNIKHYQEVLLEEWEELPLSVITSSSNKTGREDLLLLLGEMYNSVKGQI